LRQIRLHARRFFDVLDRRRVQRCGRLLRKSAGHDGVDHNAELGWKEGISRYTDLMSAPNELAELRASIRRATAALEAASERLGALENAKGGGETVVVRASSRRRDSTIAVGASLGTAVVIGLLALASPKSDPLAAAPLVAAAPAPLALAEPVVMKAPEPTPLPVVAEPAPPPAVAAPPRLPHPVRPVSMPPPAPLPLAEMGTLTIVCAPSRCDQIIDNGVPLGPGHIFNKTVAAGPHRLQLRSATGEMKTLRV